MKCIRGSILLGVTLLCGGEIVVDAPKVITPEWESKVFGVRYGVTELDNAIHEMVDGLVDDVFEEAFFERIKTAIQKHPKGEGVYTEYWDNGVLKAKLPYKDGKAHGHIHGWYDNGRDAFKGYFNEGLKQGVHITFNRTEPTEHTKEARILNYTEKGQLHGEQDLFHPTGRLWVILFYDRGRAYGALEGWDSNRKQFMSVNYKKGVRQKKPPRPPGSRWEPKSSPCSKYVNEVTNTFLNIAKKEFGASCGGAGGSMPFDVEAITVFLRMKKKGTIEEARELILKLTDRFVEVINAHEKLRPYLREYPVSHERAEILLGFCDESGLDPTDGSVTTVIIGNKNQVYYSATKPDRSFNKDHLLIEPYEEAVKIVDAKKQSKPRDA